MYALAVQSIPEGKEWLYEVKFDGYRCLAGRDSTGVTLWSRRGNLFTNQFPQIARACERLPSGSLVDGEIVAVDESGRVSFNLLQHHRSKAQALLFDVFDVLTYCGRSLLQEPLERRRETLSEIFQGVKAAPIAIAAKWEGLLTSNDPTVLDYDRATLVIDDTGGCESAITRTKTRVEGMSVSYDTIDVFAEKGKLVLTDGKLSTKFEKGGQVTVQLYVDPASGDRMLKGEGKNSKGFTYSADLKRTGDYASAQ